MQDSFYQAFKKLNDSEAYKAFLKKNGKPTVLPEEIYEVGYDNFVPFINSSCKKNNCIYDLGHLHEQYSETFDTTDDFRHYAAFSCHFCDKRIKYGEFFTCEELLEDIDSLFKKDEQAASVRRSSTKKVKRSSKTKEPTKPLRVVKKKTTVIVHPEPEAEPDSREESVQPVPAKETTKPSIKVISLHKPHKQEKLQPKKPVHSLHPPEEPPKPEHRKQQPVTATRLSLILHWSVQKSLLKSKPIPLLQDFSSQQAQAVLRSCAQAKDSNIILVPQTAFVFFDEIGQMPTPSEVRQFAATSVLSKSLHLVLLNYWRARLCQDTGLLMSAWMYELVKSPGMPPLYMCSDKLVTDKNLVTHNGDFPFILILVVINDEAFLLDYSKQTKSLLYVAFSDSPGSTDKARDDLVLQEFESIVLKIFDGELKVEARNKVSSIDPSVSPWVALHKHLFERFFPQFAQATFNMTEVLAWLLEQLLLAKTRRPLNLPDLEIPERAKPAAREPASGGVKATPKDPKTPAKLAIKEQVTTAKKPLPDQDHLKTDDVKPSVAVRAVQRTPSQPKLASPQLKPLAKDSPKGASSHPTLKKYDDVKKLLWFYFEHDKKRYQYLLKKVDEISSPEVSRYLGVDKLESLASKDLIGKKSNYPPRLDDTLSDSHHKDPEPSFEQRHKPPLHLKQNSDQLHSALNRPDNSRLLPRIDSSSRINQSAAFLSRPASNHKRRPGVQRSLVSLKSPGKLLSRPPSPRAGQPSTASDLTEADFNRLLKKLCREGCFCFPTSFYDELVSTEASHSINHARVAHYTNAAVRQGSSIFEAFPVVVVPLCEESAGESFFRVIVIDNKLQRLELFDPSNRPLKEQLLLKRAAKRVADYIQQELRARTGRAAAPREYAVVESEGPKDPRANASGLWSLYFVSQKLKGQSVSSFSPSELERFLQSLK